MQESINLKDKSGIKYDIVIRLRFDTLFFSKIDFEAIYSDLDKSGKVVIVNKP
jgi:hypothetical protein